MTSLIPWDSPDFGKAGQNVHVSSTGSWIIDAHGEEAAQS